VKGLNMAKFSYVPAASREPRSPINFYVEFNLSIRNNSLIQIMSYLYTLMQH
jgi:hypothetical protein